MQKKQEFEKTFLSSSKKKSGIGKLKAIIKQELQRLGLAVGVIAAEVSALIGCNTPQNFKENVMYNNSIVVSEDKAQIIKEKIKENIAYNNQIVESEDKAQIIKEKTLAHEIIDLETEDIKKSASGTILNAFEAKKNLDELIIEARNRIKIKNHYTKKDAISFLENIDEIIKEKGFTYKVNTLLTEGLQTKKIDCDNYSMIYLSIAEALGLPEKSLVAVKAPSHVFVRFNLDDGKYINWETTTGFEASDDFYIEKGNISESAINKGIFLKSLTKKETLGITYFNKGNAFKDQSNLEKGIKALKKLEEAIKCYDKAIELNPNDHFAKTNRNISINFLKKGYLDEGKSLFDQGKFEEAIKCYDKAIELDPKEDLAYLFKGYAFQEQSKLEKGIKALKKLEEAIKCYDKAIELNPELKWAYLEKDDFDSADYDGASKTLIYLLIGGLLSFYHLIKGLYDHKKNRKKRNEDFKKAVEKKHLKDDLEACDKAIEFDPKNARAYYNKGVIFSKLDFDSVSLKQAVKFFDKAIKLKPDFAEAYNGKGEVLMNLDLNKPKKALKAFDKAIQLKPNFVKAYFNKGSVLYSLGKFEEAVETYDKILEFDPENSEIYYEKAVALYSLGKFEEADETYDKILKFEP